MASMLLLAVFSLSIISGVSAAQTPPVQNKNITVHLNEKFMIKLESNPTTGYMWVPSYNSKVLKLVSNQFTSNNPKLIGSPGVQKIVFKTLKKGETTIVLKYVRSWDKKHPAKEIIYHVKIIK